MGYDRVEASQSPLAPSALCGQCVGASAFLFPILPFFSCPISGSHSFTPVIRLLYLCSVSIVPPVSGDGGTPNVFRVWLFFSFMMSENLSALSLIQPDINQNTSLMEPQMRRDYIKTPNTEYK